MQWMLELVRETWRVTGDMAPYLLLGFLMAAILFVLISPAFVAAHLGRGGWRQVLKAALFGVPLPLCSCGVLPVSASLREHGAGKGATLSFLISTPQTGVDSIMATQALLGPVFVVFRVVTAFVSGVVGGLLLEWVTPAAEDAAGATAPARAAQPARRTWRQGLRYGGITLPRDIGRTLLLGLVLSGLLTALVPPGALEGWMGPGWRSLLIMLLVGMPMYVCSTGSIPIAYAFVGMGVSPGAALVFLIAGPATNAAAMTTIWRILGRRAFVVYMLTVGLSALAAGVLLDQVGVQLPAAAQAHAHGEGGRWMQDLCGMVLLAMLLPSLRRRKKTD